MDDQAFGVFKMLTEGLSKFTRSGGGRKVFTKYDTNIDNVRAQYFINDDKLEIQFFCKRFPASFGRNLASWAKSIGSDVDIEFIDEFIEVPSWYCSIGFPTSPWPESYVIKKLALFKG